MIGGLLFSLLRLLVAARARGADAAAVAIGPAAIAVHRGGLTGRAAGGAGQHLHGFQPPVASAGRFFVRFRRASDSH